MEQTSQPHLSETDHFEKSHGGTPVPGQLRGWRGGKIKKNKEIVLESFTFI